MTDLTIAKLAAMVLVLLVGAIVQFVLRRNPQVARPIRRAIRITIAAGGSVRDVELIAAHHLLTGWGKSAAFHTRNSP